MPAKFWYYEINVIHDEISPKYGILSIQNSGKFTEFRNVIPAEFQNKFRKISICNKQS